MKLTFPLSAIALSTALMLAACGDDASPAAEAPAPPPPTGGTPQPPTAAPFTLELSTDKAVVMQGGTVSVKATITRAAGFGDAVQVALTGLPPGVSVSPVVIAAGATQADLVLGAEGAAPHSLPTGATATASAASARVAKPLTVTVRGPAGATDTSFAGGKVITAVDMGEDYANAVRVQSDGKILVAGSSATAGGTVVSLVRYERDGSLDAGFGSGGKVLTRVGPQGNDAANAVAIDPLGRIIVAGSSDQGASGLDIVVLRYRADGSLDTSFGNGGQVTLDFAGDTDRAWAVLVQRDGRIVVGGEANLGSATSGVDFALARLNADGSLDAGFGSGGKLTTPMKSGSGTDVVRALAVQTVNGQDLLLAAGGEGDFLAARYRPDGTLDDGWAQLGRIVGLFNASIGGARALLVDTDGRAVLAGQVDHQFAAVRLTAAGLLDTGFGALNDGRFRLDLVGNNWNEATALARQADGCYVIGGWANTTAGSSSDFAAVRLTADGTLDTAFGNAGIVFTPMAGGTRNDQSHGLVMQPDDRVPTVRAIQAGEANGSNHDFALQRLWL